MEDRETARMRKYGESKMTRITMATVPHVTSSLGLRKFQAVRFLLTRVYNFGFHVCDIIICFTMLYTFIPHTLVFTIHFTASSPPLIRIRILTSITNTVLRAIKAHLQYISQLYRAS